MKDYNFKSHFEKNHKAYQQLVGKKKDAKNKDITKRICCTTVNVQKIKPRIAEVYSC